MKLAASLLHQPQILEAIRAVKAYVRSSVMRLHEPCMNLNYLRHTLRAAKQGKQESVTHQLITFY
jgi:hypothetical protein